MALGGAQPAHDPDPRMRRWSMSRGRILGDHAVLVRGDRIERVGPR